MIKIIKEELTYINNSLHLARKDDGIFVHGHNVARYEQFSESVVLGTL